MPRHTSAVLPSCAQCLTPHLVGIVANDGQRSDPLAVKPKVLGERLRKHNEVTVGYESADGPSVLFRISGREALIMKNQHA